MLNGSGSLILPTMAVDEHPNDIAENGDRSAKNADSTREGADVVEANVAGVVLVTAADVAEVVLVTAADVTDVVLENADLFNIFSGVWCVFLSIQIKYSNIII